MREMISGAPIIRDWGSQMVRSLTLLTTYPLVFEGLLYQLPLHRMEGRGVLDAVVLHRVRVVVALTDFAGHCSK